MKKPKKRKEDYKFPGTLSSECLEDNIEYPIRLINHGMKIYNEYFNWRGKLNNPYAIGEYYKSLRDHKSKKAHKFPDEYVETIILSIQNKIKIKYLEDQKEKFNFHGLDKVRVVNIVQTYQTSYINKEIYKQLFDSGLPEDLIKLSLKHATEKAINKNNIDELLDLVQEYLNKGKY